MRDAISCADCRPYLPWYLSSQLDDERRLLVQHHLASCERCQADAAQWREVAAAVRAADAAAPPHLWEQITAHLATSPSSMPLPTKGITTLEFDNTTPDTATAVATPPIKARKYGGLPQRAYPVTAAVLLVAMAVMLLFFLRPGQPQPGASPGTDGFSTAACPDPVPLHLPQEASLVRLQMVSAADGWLIGSFHDPASPKDGQSDPLLMRFHHCQWTQVKLSLMHGFSLSGLDMLAPDEGWAIGTYAPQEQSITQEKSVILHDHDGQWQEEAITAETHADIGYHYNQIVMTSPEDGWIVASAAQGGGDYVLRKQQGEWSVADQAFAATVSQLRGVALQGETVWGYGTSRTSTPVIARFVQGQWHNEALPAAILAQQGGIVQISVIASDNIWAVGNAEPYASFVIHFDGTSWAQMPLPGGITHPYPKGLVMASAQEGWVVVQSVETHETTQTLHYLHGVWEQGPALPAPTSLGEIIITDLTPAFAGEAWGLGSVALNTKGTVVPTISDESATVIIHLHDGRWDYYNPYPHR